MSSSTYAPRRADFASDVDYCTAVESYETAFMQRLARVPPQDFSNGAHADEVYEVYWENGTPRAQPRRCWQLRYRALPREELAVSLDDCGVCYGELTKHKSATTNCGHTLCSSCMTKCLTSTSSCPCCRSTVDTVTRYRAHPRNVP